MTINLINGKYYIGKCEGTKNTYIGSGVALRNAIAKYGKENFKRIILERCDSKEELSIREKYWIALFDATNDSRSYNIAEGGTGGFSHLTKEDIEHRVAKRYGTHLGRPEGAIDGDYIQKYVVEVDGELLLIDGMDNVSKYLGLEISQAYKYLGIEKPKKGQKYNSLLIDYYTESYYLIEGKIYKTSDEVVQEYGVSYGTLSYRCLKTDRIDWWKIVEVKEKWKNI